MTTLSSHCVLNPLQTAARAIQQERPGGARGVRSSPKEQSRLVTHTASPPEDLLPAVARGDAAAVKACLDRYGALVWSLARRMCRSGTDAEDAVQEIFVSVWKNAGRFDATKGSEVTFIATIARRRLIDRMRQAGRRPNESPIESGGGMAVSQDSVGAPVELREEVGIASRAMAELSEDQRRVLQMSIGHGLSHEKIAEATGIPLGTVKTHIRRGLIRVRALLEEHRERTGREVQT
jgi:RNA polymerase sigma-70 factor (ECF subfamily)